MNTRVLQIGGGVAMAAIIVVTTAAWNWGQHDGESPKGSLITVAAAELDMAVEDLVGELHDGTTIAALAEERGVDTDVIVQAALEPISERISQAVEDGRITEEEAADRLAQAEERITERLEQTAPVGDGPEQMGRHGARGMGGQGFGQPHGLAGMGQGFAPGHGFGQRLGPAGMGQGFGPGTSECLAEAPAV